MRPRWRADQNLVFPCPKPTAFLHKTQLVSMKPQPHSGSCGGVTFMVRSCFQSMASIRGSSLPCTRWIFVLFGAEPLQDLQAFVNLFSCSSLFYMPAWVSRDHLMLALLSGSSSFLLFCCHKIVCASFGFLWCVQS